jgi:hypothetical protein
MKFSYRIIMSLVGLVCLGMGLIPAIQVFTGAQTLPPDVGLVTQLSGSGDVTYINESYQKAQERAQPFMRIRQGDLFKVTAGAMVQLVYFQNGRKETWKGPAVFVVGGAQSRAEGEKGIEAQPEVTILPTGVSQGLRRIPILLRRAGLSRSGTTQVRGVGGGPQKAITLSEEEKAEIKMAKEIYQSFRKQTKAEDITPELTLLGVLADYEQYEEMERVIKDALEIQPESGVLKELLAWVRTQREQPKTRK